MRVPVQNRDELFDFDLDFELKLGQLGPLKGSSDNRRSANEPSMAVGSY